jgi:uncharacterized protein YaiL (DUF2058 family)
MCVGHDYENQCIPLEHLVDPHWEQIALARREQDEESERLRKLEEQQRREQRDAYLVAVSKARADVVKRAQEWSQQQQGAQGNVADHPNYQQLMEAVARLDSLLRDAAKWEV